MHEGFRRSASSLAAENQQPAAATAATGSAGDIAAVTPGGAVGTKEGSIGYRPRGAGGAGEITERPP